MTKRQLKAYRDIRGEIEDLKERLKELEATMYDPKTPTPNAAPAPLHGVSDPTSAKALQYMELVTLYRTRLRDLYRVQLEVEKAIETLEPRERRLMRLYYLDGLTWEQVCVEMSYSWMQIHRIHAKALDQLKDV